MIQELLKSQNPQLNHLLRLITNRSLQYLTKKTTDENDASQIISPPGFEHYESDREEADTSLNLTDLNENIHPLESTAITPPLVNSNT